MAEHRAEPVGHERQWYSVRRVIQHRPGTFEERITLWLSLSSEEAVELSAAEAEEYAQTLEAEDLGLAQCFLLDDFLLRLAQYDRPAQLPPAVSSGAEVFSLIRDVQMDAGAYLRTYFATGNERHPSTD